MSASGSGSKPKVNLRSTAVKRIMQEASELSNPEEDDFVAGPLESDIFEWHCTMRGVKGSEYEGGLYHLRILLPPSYPMSAPDIILMTPNGRFELGKKICIDGLTSFHAGSWQPAWGVRTAITGLRSFWMQGGEALSAIGALDYSKEERKRLAQLSRDWVCPTCGVKNHELLSPTPPSSPSSSSFPAQPSQPSSESENDISDVNAGRVTASTLPNITSPATVDETSTPHLTPSTIPVDTTASEPIAATTSHDLEARPPHSPPTTHVAQTSSSSRPVMITSPSNPPRAIPIWLDVTLFVFIATLVMLIARRLA